MSRPGTVATFRGQALVGGAAEGIALASAEPLSFWGGYDYETGEIIDRRHPLSGQRAAGRILALPFARGSSTTSAVLLEAVRAGTAPAAIITTGADHFLALASIVADEMYSVRVPVVALAPDELAMIRTGLWVEVRATGEVQVTIDER